MSIQEKESKGQGTMEKAVEYDKAERNRALKNVIERNNSCSQRGCGGRRQEGLHLFESRAAAQARSLWQASASDSRKKQRSQLKLRVLESTGGIRLQ